VEYFGGQIVPLYVLCVCANIELAYCELGVSSYCSKTWLKTLWSLMTGLLGVWI